VPFIAKLQTPTPEKYLGQPLASPHRENLLARLNDFVKKTFIPAQVYFAKLICSRIYSESIAENGLCRVF